MPRVIFKAGLCLLVFAYGIEAADLLRHKSNSLAKAASPDKPSQFLSEHPTRITKAETQVLLQQKETCVDKDHRCPDWASQGECAKNPAFMLGNCELSCKVCKEGSQSIKIGPLGRVEASHTSDKSKVTLDSKYPHEVISHRSVGDLFWCKWWMYNVAAYIPYAILIVLMALIWQCLGGRTPPGEVLRHRSPKGHSHSPDFEYGLFDTESIFNRQMWICVCSFCCCPIRMADTYSKGKTRPIIRSFWVALGVTLLMGLLADLTCGVGMLLFLCMAVYFRQKIRQAYGLPRGRATVAWDCLYWCFCPWCTAAQEARQIESAGYGFDDTSPREVVGTSVYGNAPQLAGSGSRLPKGSGEVVTLSSTPRAFGLR